MSIMCLKLSHLLIGNVESALTLTNYKVQSENVQNICNKGCLENVMNSDPYNLHGTAQELNLLIHEKIQTHIGPSGSVN